ncbi:hypothetical protein DVH24_035016 [Malus domestica]|uniref:Uncharacterized protein n=1 Tax=Malus domestica TaxID=3750 RepID=A0A498IHH0_MALDO|nr:hypothetical protein DVH24_035016 [Malus domestica]
MEKLTHRRGWVPDYVRCTAQSSPTSEGSKDKPRNERDGDGGGEVDESGTRCGRVGWQGSGRSMNL